MPECARLACAIAMCDVAPPSESESISVRMLVRKKKCRQFISQRSFRFDQMGQWELLI